MSFKFERAIAYLLCLVLLSSCSSGPEEEASVTTTPSPVASAVQTNKVKSEVTATPIESKSPSSSQSASDEPLVESAHSAKPEDSASKSASQQAIPKKTKRPSQSPTSQKLPDRYEFGKAYPWEEDPTRYGIPYTDQKPIAYTKTAALFVIPNTGLLLVYAGLVVVRGATLYRGAVSGEFEDVGKVYLVKAICKDGSTETLTNVDKIGWLPGQHPATFTYHEMQEGETVCGR